MANDGCYLLKEVRKDRECERLYCNVIILVNGVKFFGHRFLLGSVSGYFNCMFRCKLKERYTYEVVIYGPYDAKLTAETVHLVFQYIYTGVLKVTDRDVFDVLFAADYLDIAHLKGICLDYLQTSLSDNMWMDIPVR